MGPHGDPRKTPVSSESILLILCSPRSLRLCVRSPGKPVLSIDQRFGAGLMLQFSIAVVCESLASRMMMAEASVFSDLPLSMT